MCHWMGSHFHDWIDCNGVAFSTELLQWGRIFSGFGGNNIQASREFVYLTIIRRRLSKYSAIFTEPEVNNCFSTIFSGDEELEEN